jgi:hypothetical protein
MTLTVGQIAPTGPSIFTIGLKMNEKIRDLALNAIVENIAAEGWVFSDQELQQFAESIVKVCIKQGELIQSQTVMNASEQYAAGREMGIQVYMNQIQKVFGVK